MVELLANPIVAGAVTGFLTAFSVDYMAFRSWKSYDEAFTYDWKLASFRWFQGVIVGGLSAAGLGAMV